MKPFDLRRDRNLTPQSGKKSHSRRNPRCDRQEWIDELVSQYPAEVNDTPSNNPHEVYPALEDWWDCEEFEDAQTGFNKRFCEWAEYFASERSVELYDLLAEARHEINLTRSTFD